MTRLTQCSVLWPLVLAFFLPLLEKEAKLGMYPQGNILEWCSSNLTRYTNPLGSIRTPVLALALGWPETMHCCHSCWSEDHSLSSKTINGSDVPSQPVRCGEREDVPLGHLWVVAFQWNSSSGSKPRGNSVGSSKWPQDVIMSLQEFSRKGSSLGVKLHTLKQQSGGYLIRAASGTHPS